MDWESGIDVEGDPFWAEAKATLLVVSRALYAVWSLDYIIFVEGNTLNVIGSIQNSYYSAIYIYIYIYIKLAIEETKPSANFYAINN